MLTESVVAEARYGYWSQNTSSPCRRARSIMAVVVKQLTCQSGFQVTLWCEICSGTPASRAMRMASSVARTTVFPSPRICVA